MSKNQEAGVVIPSSPEIQKKIKDALREASASYTRIEGERDFLKELFSDLSKNTEIPKGYLTQIAKFYHKQNFSKAVADKENVFELYERLFQESQNRGDSND